MKMDVDCSPEISSKQTPPPLGATGQSEASELEDIRDVLWGNQISDTVFARWSQGGWESFRAAIKNCAMQFLYLSSASWLVGLPRSPILSLVAGFEFSEAEPTALVQYQGGPCAVIAPVQAFLLQSLLQDLSLAGGAGTLYTFSEV